MDETTDMLSANVILEDLLAHIDEEGNRKLMLDEIIDHRKNQETYIIMRKCIHKQKEWQKRI